MTLLFRYSAKKEVTPTHDGGTVLALDPGNHGALLGWYETLGWKGTPNPFPKTPDFYLPISNDLAGAAFVRQEISGKFNRIRTLIVEDQFIGINKNSAIMTVLSAGVTMGLILSSVKVDRVVLTKPATWQSPLPKDDGPRKGKAKRRSMAHAQAHIPELLAKVSTKPRRQGVADSFGMADWFIQHCAK